MKARIVALEPEKIPDGFLPIREAAQYIGISEVYLRRLLQNGKIKGQHFGKRVIIAREMLDTWKSQHGTIRQVGAPLVPEKAFEVSVLQVKRAIVRLESAFEYTKEEPFGKAMAHLKAALADLEKAATEL